MSTDTLQIGEVDDQSADPAEAPEGAEGDGNKVELDANASTDPQDAPKSDEGEASRPEWLDEKFESPEALQDAYKALEKKLGSKGADEGTDDSEPEATSDEPLSLQDAAQAYVDNDGEIPEDIYEKFANAGIGKDLVDSFIENQVNEASRFQESLLETVGGKDAFDKISEWALANKTEAEIEGFNKAMRSGDEEVAKMALKGLRSDYVDAKGQDPDLVLGDGGDVRTGPQPFESWDQVIEAMSNPKYRTDRAYRAKVDKRLAVSEL